MGLITVFSYPILAQLEHDDIPIGTADDGWGDYGVFEIAKVYWEELAGETWNVQIVHPGSGKNMVVIIEPYEIGSKGLPPPARFPSNELTNRCTIVRV